MVMIYLGKKVTKSSPEKPYPSLRIYEPNIFASEKKDVWNTKIRNFCWVKKLCSAGAKQDRG